MTQPAFQLEVVRTHRRRKSASIELHGSVVRVRVPHTLPEQRVQELIVKRTPWIRAKLREQAQRPVVPPREYVSGEAFSYLGKNYRLKVNKGGDAPQVKMEGGIIIVTIPATQQPQQVQPVSQAVKAHLHAWYRQQAQRILAEKTARYARIIGVSPASVAVEEYKSRWGSCSSKGDIRYNWKIILAPHSIIDYVVIHELCHLIEHNHSPAYWQHVEHHAPHWRAHKHYLKTTPFVV